MVRTLLVQRLATLLALALLFAAFLPNPVATYAQEKKNLRMVFVSLAWNSEIPFRIALARGFFKSQGIQVEPILIRGGPAAIAALTSGEVDFASIGGAQAVFRSNSRGLDLYIIGSISNTTNYVLLGNKQTRTIEDLKGKTVGITGAGSFSEFAIKTFLRKYNLEPNKDVMLRTIGESPVRAAALEKGLIAAAPFSPEDAIRLMKAGFLLVNNLNESLRIPQTILVTRGDVLQKYPETSKRLLKALILGIQIAKSNKTEAIKAGYEAGLKGDSDIVNQAYDLYVSGLTNDFSINLPGMQLMVDEDKRNGLVDSKFTLDKVINDRILKIAQQELRAEGKLKP